MKDQSNFTAPVPRHKEPLGVDKTLAHWMLYKETLPKRWPLGQYSREQVGEHQIEGDCWVILHGFVFNITPYLAYHPGGKAILMKFAGQDVTVPFRKRNLELGDLIV